MKEDIKRWCSWYTCSPRRNKQCKKGVLCQDVCTCTTHFKYCKIDPLNYFKRLIYIWFFKNKGKKKGKKIRG